MTILATICVLGSPYRDFHARLHPFGVESLHTWDVTKLKEDGYDVTSLLYERRDELVGALSRAKQPAQFDARDVNLLVQLGRKTWIVDARGTVQCGRLSARLSNEDFDTLRLKVWQALPDKSRDP